MTALSRRAAYTFGLRAETLAAFYLRLKGYRVLARRYASPVGEIDLVAVDGSTLVIVEVKTRSSDDFGQPLESITASKLERLYVLASQWARAHNQRFSGFRIDAVGVLDDGSGDPRIEHVRAVI